MLSEEVIIGKESEIVFTEQKKALMQTLNEVIKANECCDHGELDSRCEDCPYNGIGACCAERELDALHYLKTIETTENLYHDVVNELSKWKDEDWKDRYLPLTWEELKMMEDKPVWVEFFYEDGQHFDSNWFLIGFVSESFCDIIGKLGTSRLVKNDYWQAYRKEKE